MHTYHIVAGIIHKDDKVLLVQQQGLNDEKPLWALPGGVVETGESLTDALVREINEETGLIINAVGVIVYITQIIDMTNNTQAIAFIFEIDDWIGNITPQDPDQVILAAAFFPPRDAEQVLQESSLRQIGQPFLGYLLKQYPQGTVWIFQD